MKNLILFFVLFIIFSIESYSQIVFEKGYFIDESDQKTECLIKNLDWRNNPTEFEYKILLEGEVQKTDIQKVKEFGIDKVCKYTRSTVKIDKSSTNLNDISDIKDPIFIEERIFLKVLTEGKASLFIYVNKDLTRFFFKTEDSGLSQLVYKQYWYNNLVAENNYFREQIFIALKCDNITQEDVENAKYYKKDLERLFIKYNKCTNSDSTNYEAKPKKDLFNLTIKPSLNLNALKIENISSDSRETDFGTKLSFRIDAEAEFILPFNKNKCGILIKPSYQYYKTEKTEKSNNLIGGALISKVKYQTIDLPIGIRYYFFLNDNSKIYTNISYIFGFNCNSSLNFYRTDGTSVSSLKIYSSRNIGLGVGYKFMDRYSMEICYQTNRNIFDKYKNWHSDYQSLQFMLGYSLF